MRKLPGVLLVLLTFAPALFAVERLEVEWDRDPDYLRYVIEEIRFHPSGAFRKPIGSSNLVVKPKRRAFEHGLYVNAWNQDYTKTDDFAQVEFAEYPAFSATKGNSVSLAINYMAVYEDVKLGRSAVVGTGDRNDSSFVFRVSPGPEKTEYKCVATGMDRTGDGQWTTDSHLCGLVDYDFDGVDELFVNVVPGRDLSPRLLVCLELPDLDVEWSLSVASGTVGHLIQSSQDSERPFVMFVTCSPGHGAADTCFSDRFQYVVDVNHIGNITYKRVVGRYGEIPSSLVTADSASFYLTHGFPLEYETEVPESVVSVPQVSRIDWSGNVIESVDLPEKPSHLWVSDYGNDGSADLFTLSQSGTVRIFDSRLRLVAGSEETELRAYVGRLDSWYDSKQEVFVMVSSGETGFYTRRLEKLASLLAGEFGCIEAIELDSVGRLAAFVASGTTGEFFGRVRPRRTLEYLKVFYFEYQDYIVAILPSLLVGLLVVNFFRGRVTRQKREIEAVHRELAETHEALKRAQQTIIAQEKYRQAKDIAGGFAHEIRNALFPADSSMTRLRSMGDFSEADSERVNCLLSAVDSSITRVIDLTSLISQYTKLDAEFRPEPVTIAKVIAEVVSCNQIELDEAGIAVEISGHQDAVCEGNVKQMFILFNNLLRNSIDALTGIQAPSIICNWRVSNGLLEVSWSDNGVGIKAEDLPRIFDTFFSTKPSKGTGLGLCIAKKIVDLYRGSITASSDQMSGARFDIRLRLWRDEQE